MGRKERQKPKPRVSFEIGEDADRAFLDAMQELDPSHIPGKDLPVEAPTPRKSPGSKAKSKKAPSGNEPDCVIDLHGLTQSEAKDVAVRRIEEELAGADGIIHIRVITGKGRHSGKGGGVLARSVHEAVRKRFERKIQRIDSAPADVVVGGLPVRGHFDLWLKS